MARHGFRPAVGSEDAWVRRCCEGALQRIQVSWVMRFAQICVIANLDFGYHLVDVERLWAAHAGKLIAPRGYTESTTTLLKLLAELLPSRPRKEWKFPRDERPRELLDDMALVIQRVGLPFLEKYRSREEVFAEMKRVHLARRNPSEIGELKFASAQACFGERDEAGARIRRVLAAIGSGGGEVAIYRRAIAEGLLADLAA